MHDFLLNIEVHPLIEWEPHNTGNWSVKCCITGRRNAWMKVLGHANTFESLKKALGDANAMTSS